jgi:hypothetical protein
VISARPMPCLRLHITNGRFPRLLLASLSIEAKGDNRGQRGQSRPKGTGQKSRPKGTGQITDGKNVFHTLFLYVIYTHSLLCDFRVSKLRVGVFTTAFPDSFMASSSSGPPEAVVRRPRNFSL